MGPLPNGLTNGVQTGVTITTTSYYRGHYIANPNFMHRKEGKFLTGSITVSAWNGIAIWIKVPATRQKLLMAPYGPGVVAQLVPPPAPKGKAPAPVGAAIINGWPPANPYALPSRKSFTVSLMKQIANIGKGCYTHIQRRSVLSADGAGGMPTVRQQGDLDYRMKACEHQ